ncbi:MAG: right-handed parallel beta-helix repeat-containing protein [Acidimicrobiales bacterium]
MVPSAALAAVPACGSTINVNTTLTGNMTCPGNGLNIGGPNVVLDLNGFMITGPGPDVRPGPNQVYAGVRVNSPGAVVKNGRIEAFTIAVTTTSGGDNVEVTGLTLRNNGQGYLTQSGAPGGLGPYSDHTWFHHNKILGSTSTAMVIQGHGHRVESNQILANRSGVAIRGSGVTFRTNTVDGNRSTGVNVGGDVLGDNNVIAGNSITNNTGNGVNIGGPSTTKVLQGNRIESNRIASNGDPATSFGAVNVFSSNGAVVSNNQVVGISKGNGISIQSGVTNTTVSGNQLTSNLDGLFVQSTSTGSTLVGNNAVRNVRDGINAASPSTTLTANTALQNGAFGIRAVNGVTDGGGNKASGNGVAQCSPSLVCT